MAHTGSSTHALKALGGQIGSNRRWAAVQDRKAAMQPAWDGRLRKFKEQALELRPDLAGDDAALTEVAYRLRKAYMAELSLKAAKVQRLRRELAAIEAELDASGVDDAGSDGVDL